MSDMIIDVDESLLIRELKAILVAIQSEGTSINVLNASIPNVIQFRRKIIKQWNPDRECWEGCPFHITTEPFVLLRMTGEELIRKHQDSCLVSFLESVKSAFKDRHIVIILEGLASFYKSHAKMTKDNFNLAMRGAASGFAPSQEMTALPNPQELQRLLIQVELEMNCGIYQTEKLEETAEYVISFTRELAILFDIEYVVLFA